MAGAALYSDELWGYYGLHAEYEHKVIDHAVKYVDGRVHTNGMENVWSLLKRGISGTYVSVEPFHLFRYLDEQEFRYNNRGNKENPVSRWATVSADTLPDFRKANHVQRVDWKEPSSRIRGTVLIWQSD